jgi:D-alanyl-lipoteichoic acid acyltransferase DltB (MBOAT superfamily)
VLFNSLTYLIFLPATAIIYFSLPCRLRWMFLLAASWIFYMAWRPELIILLLFTTFANYLAAILINASKEEKSRKLALAACMIVNFSLLFAFKYLDFFLSSARALFALAGITLPAREFSLVLPMGISFYTFQAASYTLDVYFRRIKPEPNFFKVSLFLTFFPQLVAGPIERAENLLGQLFIDSKPQASNIAAGIKLLLIGYFKKAVVADRLSAAVAAVYASPRNFGGLSLSVATIFFAFQIYCDFSGYSDIALASAKILNIDLMQNFRQPYLSSSVKEFWRRWHISLSEWLKDYLYIPMGGGRTSKLKRVRNVMLTFAASGLWHGANWTYVVWGLMHGAFQAAGDLLGKPCGAAFEFAPKRFRAILGTISTFCLTCLAWVFFRAASLKDACYIASHLTDDFRLWGSAVHVYQTLSGMGPGFLEILINFGLVAFVAALDIFAGDESVFQKAQKLPAAAQAALYFIISLGIISLGVFYNAGQFIYFQF